MRVVWVVPKLGCEWSTHICNGKEGPTWNTILSQVCSKSPKLSIILVCLTFTSSNGLLYHKEWKIIKVYRWGEGRGRRLGEGELCSICKRYMRWILAGEFANQWSRGKEILVIGTADTKACREGQSQDRDWDPPSLSCFPFCVLPNKSASRLLSASEALENLTKGPHRQIGQNWVGERVYWAR
jgi:hypothetical protein